MWTRLTDSFSDCDRDSDVESDSSTLVYDHEPFDTFQTRVKVFAHSKIWPDADLDDIAVERLLGGGYNRIIGLTRQENEQTGSSEVRYILRLPRFDAAQVDREVAVLSFLERNTQIPAPRVITFDDTEEKMLISRYMIQNRIAGTDLFSTYPQLDHATRVKVAHELGSVFHKMLDTRSSVAGVLTFSAEDKSLDAPLFVTPFKPQDNLPGVLYSNSPTTRTVLDLLTSSFKAQKAAALESYSKDYLTPMLMDKFYAMASELDARGWLKDVPNCLVHLDLAPRNILINPTDDIQLPVLSAVLDWDSAVFAPMFMACEPPLWMWGWLEDEEEDERTANDDPPTHEDRELKKTFEEAAGKDYMRFAYGYGYRLARRLFRFAVDGQIRSSQDHKEATRMLEEWEALR
ncbi:kinase-like domain-containing protein [Hypoxylon crocopeplum]|nr:kinase-like domain-containing protein [Hypoxylon crocopeplum]